ncbi:MAG TPA: menaquinone biosynthesis decarboxylase [Nitrososphaeraceae archaeon]|nr:menaquinone biosynthesis decarboxylase [Nitrososphaeraceae archaeon]
MPLESLRDLVDVLEQKGELTRVRASVDPELEVAEIMRRLMYDKDRPAVLFENVKGYTIPILGNTFGSNERLRIALEEDDFSQIGNRIVDLTRMKMPTGVFGKLRMLPKLSEISDYGPKHTDSGPVKELVLIEQQADLYSLPILKSFKGDAGRFITFGLTVTKHPETEVTNMGVYRMQILNARKAIMHWQIHKRGAQHLEILKDKKSKNEEVSKDSRIAVAVVIGADPATMFSAVAPVPEGMDKYLFSGIVRKKGIKLVKCNTIDLEVPANAEIVLEGYVDPDDIQMEGPFGDHTGYYTPAEPYPCFNLTCISMRKNPIYLTTVVGKPILEDAYIGKVIERSFLPLIQMFHPEVVDFSMPAAAWFQGLAIISIKKRYPGQAKKVMMGLWGMGQLSLTKMFVTVDHDINVHDMDEVLWAVTTRTDPKRDLMFIENAPTDTLDPSSPLLNLGSKVGIDATTKWHQEGFSREIQVLATVDEETQTLVSKRWGEYGFSK